MKKKSKNCENCDTIFEYKTSRHKYCSTRCRKKAFRLRNIEKIKAYTKEYLSRPEVKEMRKEQKRRYRASEKGKKLRKKRTK